MDKLTKAEFEKQFGFYKSKVLHIFMGDYCLYRKGDLSVESFDLDYESLPFDDDGKAAGVIIDGNLTVNGAVINADWDEGPFLIVTGDVKTKNFAVSGSEVYIKGNLTADDLVWMEYNHGSCRIDGDVTAQLLICQEHRTTISGAVNASFIGINPLGKIKAKKVRNYTDVLADGLVEESDEDQIIDTQLLLQYMREGKQIVDIAAPVNLPEFEAVKKKDWDTVKNLIEDGTADVNAVNEHKQTLLHLAAQKGKTDIIALLLAKGADINLTDKKGNTPLSLAARYSSVKAVQFLLENGADAKYPQKKFAPLVCMVEKGNTKGVDLLLQYGAYLDSGNSNGRTALCIALYEGNAKLAHTLINAGADINLADDSDLAPLQLAAGNGTLEMVKTLIEKGADIKHSSHIYKSALFVAVTKGHFVIVKYLVENGADVNMDAGALGQNTLAVAIDIGHDEMAEYLLEKGAEPRKALYYSANWDMISVVKWLHAKGYNVLDNFDFTDLWPGYMEKGVKVPVPVTLLGVAEYLRENGAVNNFLKELMKKK